MEVRELRRAASKATQLWRGAGERERKPKEAAVSGPVSLGG